jgi:hypothetical protein
MALNRLQFDYTIATLFVSVADIYEQRHIGQFLRNASYRPFSARICNSLSVVFNMHPLVFALFIVLPFARAAVVTTTPTVRTHSVIKFLESSGTVIDWVPVGDNVSLTTFPNEDWASWESELLSMNDSITILNPSPPYDKRLESLDYRFSCYRSGSWAKDSVLEAHIDHACETFKHGLNVGKLLNFPGPTPTTTSH